jgi:hypothetical protein
MISTTLLGVAFCSCDFALLCPIPGWAAVETGTRKRGRHGRFRSGVVRRDRSDRRARRERLRIQRPPHPPVDVARSTGVVGNLSGNCDCIRCWGLGLRRDIHERRIFRLLRQQRSPFNRQFVRLFVHRAQFRRSADRPAEVLLLGIVSALAARTGFIDGRRVMTPMLLAMRASAHRATRTSAEAHHAVGPTRRRGYD